MLHMGEGEQQKGESFLQDLFHTFNAIYVMKNREPYGLAFPAKTDRCSHYQASHATRPRSPRNKPSTSQCSFFFFSMNWNFTISGLIDKNHYPGKCSKNQGEGNVCMCVCMCACVCTRMLYLSCLFSVH